jgi:hypothetical protein
VQRRAALLAVILLGLALRLAALPLPGTEDVRTWKIWAFAPSRHVTHVYGVGGAPPVRGVLTGGAHETTVDYPLPRSTSSDSSDCPMGRGWAVPRLAVGVDLTVLLSVANICVLVWHPRAVGRENRSWARV